MIHWGTQQYGCGFIFAHARKIARTRATPIRFYRIFIKSSASFHFTAASIRGLLFILLSRAGSSSKPTETQSKRSVCVRVIMWKYVKAFL